MATRETNDDATARAFEEKNKYLAMRASELALNHGRPADAITDADLIWAKRELKPMELLSPKVPEGSGI